MTLAVHLDRGSPVTLQDQLFEQLRQLILTGGLKPNSRVIATRFLADQAGVSRTTVLLAYERLISEGYLETRPAVGTFVCGALPDEIASANRVRALPSIDDADPPLAANDHARSGLLDFSPRASDASHLLPEKAWLQGFRAVLERRTGDLGRPQPAAGVCALRRAITDHLAATRGVQADPENVIVVAGRRQACTLIAHVLLRRGDRVVTETPGDEDINTIFRIRGSELVYAPADAQGLETDRLPAGPARLAYVTPTRQNPLGGRLPATRRARLLAWAHEAGAYLIEDDGDSEIRYHATAPQPIYAQDARNRVFYLGSFSRTLGAGLGLGYVVAPPEMVEPILAMKSAGEEGGAWLEQMIVADLLATGGYERHLRRVRKIYLERRDGLIDALRSHFGEPELIGSEIGSQFTWAPPDGLPAARAIAAAARRRGVNLEAVYDEFAPADSVSRYQDRALVMGYAGLPVDDLCRGVGRLAESLRI